MKLRYSIALWFTLFTTFVCIGQDAPPANTRAASLYDSGLNALSGSDINRNQQKALSDIEASASLGYAPAQTAMAYFAETGILTARDASQVATWCKKAAEQGDIIGEWCLGREYFRGVGTLQDKREAERWLTKAAERGDPFAAYLLGMVEEELDYTAAPKWFRQAAEQGLPEAQRQLGLLLKQGRGVDVDKYHAYIWLLLATHAGEAGLGTDLSQLEGDLGSNNANRAKSEARQLELTTSRSAASHGCTGWPGELDSIPSLPPPEIQRFCR